MLCRSPKNGLQFLILSCSNFFFLILVFLKIRTPSCYFTNYSVFALESNDCYFRSTSESMRPLTVSEFDVVFGIAASEQARNSGHTRRAGPVTDAIFDKTIPDFP